MNFPFFYIAAYSASQKEIVLDEDTSRHIVQVLRMKTGEPLNLTDGKGNLLTGEISNAHKKHCEVRVTHSQFIPPAARKVTIAVSLIKNANRFEWFLEKATEIGVNEIIPLLCERTEKEKFRQERMHQLCISAMLQSRQTWLPALREPTPFEDWVMKKFDNAQKFIAHCVEGEKRMLSSARISQLPVPNSQILIGPEGDFTSKEIELALQNKFIPVSLGNTRLRTETAAVVAAAILKNI